MSKVMEDFGRGEFIVNCETMEEAFLFVSICYANNIVWSNNPFSFVDENDYTNYDSYEQFTCYRAEDKKMCYADKEFYEYIYNVRIISFKKFINMYDGINYATYPNFD